ncbi:MAG: ATP-binding protein, partial [Euryarchaeota archaeon]|nr:ATP-binding protein [Euryarchaeota archaeon]
MKEEEMQLVLEEGEGYKIEFKESLANIDKEIVAFANSSGGRIFLGIGDDNGVKGIRITNELKSQIQDRANNCQPPVTVLLEEFGNILVVKVLEGADKPYKCSAGFYTRVGPNSQKLDRDDIIEFFKSEGKIRFDELVNLRFDYDVHFDHGKFDRFLRLAGISKVLDTPSMLVNLGVAEKQEGKLIFNNAGILFFAKNLHDIYFHTAVTCALFDGTEKVDVLDRRDFNEDLISNIDGAMIFLKRYLAVRYEMTGEPRRREIPEIPYDALREAVINAVAHRDYFERGTNVMVEIFDDRIEITNFGGLVKGLRPEDFGKKSMPRNAKIADLLHRVEYIERMGTGINKIRRLMDGAGLPPVEFEFDTFFTATFRRPESGKSEDVELEPEDFSVKFREDFSARFNEILRHEGVSEGVSEGVKSRLANEIAYIATRGYLKRTDIEKNFNISTA